jgi:type I restriction enzyme M protein
MIKKPVSNVIFTEDQKEIRWSSFKNKEPQTMFDLSTKPIGGGISVFDHMKQMGAENGVFAKYMSGAKNKNVSKKTQYYSDILHTLFKSKSNI